MDYRGPESHARGVYHTQDTMHMGTVSVNQEEEADTRIMQESSKISGRNERGQEAEKPQTRSN